MVQEKSSIWKRFKIAVNAKTGKPEGYARCNDCQSFLSFDSAKSGTSHLNRHHCKALGTLAVSKYFTSEAKKMPKTKKDSVLDACVQLCTKDLRPFEIVSGEGFRDFAQEMIKVGSVYGNLPASEVLPYATTISRHIKESAETLRGRIVEKMKILVHDNCCAATTDMWMDDFKKNSFITVTLHYLDEEWNLISIVLMTCHFPDERKTGFNIRRELCGKLERIGFQCDAVEKITFVTDQGSNIVNALQPYKRLNCSAHLINTVLRNIFSVDFLKDSSLLLNTVTSTKALVTYLKQSGLVNCLKKTVHQDVETRWNTKLLMFQSVLHQFNDITDVLTERGELHRIENIDKGVLENLVDFLLPFRDASVALEADKSITLPYVLLWRAKLLRLCQIQSRESDVMQKLKTKAQEIMEMKFVISLEHRIATFLCPEFRQLRMLNENEMVAVLEHVRNEITRMKNSPSYSKEESNKTLDVSESVQKMSYFSDWVDMPREDTSEQDEVEKYLRFPTSSSSLNTWWKEHHLDFPCLSLLARRILCIPASSASSERNFSAAAMLVQDRRSRLSPEVTDAILLLHSNT